MPILKSRFLFIWPDFPGTALLYSFDSVLILKFLIRRPGALVELSPFRHFSLFLVRLLHLLLLPDHLFKVILKLFVYVYDQINLSNLLFFLQGDHEIDSKVNFLKPQIQICLWQSNAGRRRSSSHQSEEMERSLFYSRVFQSLWISVKTIFIVDCVSWRFSVDLYVVSTLLSQSASLK